MPRLRLYALVAVSLLVTGCDLLFPRPPAGCFDRRPALIPSQVPNPEGLPYVPGQLLVRYQAPLGTLDLNRDLSVAGAVRQDFGLTLLQAGGLDGPDLVAVPAGHDVEVLAALLSADPRVRYAEPNHYLYPQAIPNDPLLPEQWNLLHFGLPEAWEIQAGSPEIIIAIIDTGVDTAHEDLRGRLLPGCDFYNRDNDPSPGQGDQAAHGTHVTGIAAATGNNGRGVAGVTWAGAGVVPIRVFDDSGSGGAAALIVAEAIRWAAGLPVQGVNPNPYPAKIVNLSLGADVVNQTLNEAVQQAREAGAMVVAAAGNGSRTNGITTPANAPGAVAVGSVDHDGQRSSFSNFDAGGRRTVDLMAPGGYGPSFCGTVLSTLPGDTYGCRPGTSMAAPFVAGVAALVWSQNPSWTADEVFARLQETAYFDDSWDPNEYGAGVVCADAALGAATTCGR